MPRSTTVRRSRLLAVSNQDESTKHSHRCGEGDDLGPDFFNLQTGLAGELIQKFVNYRVRVAIVLPTPDSYGDRFSELAYEHATHPTVRFVRSFAEAKDWLGS